MMIPEGRPGPGSAASTSAAPQVGVAAAESFAAGP